MSMRTFRASREKVGTGFSQERCDDNGLEQAERFKYRAAWSSAAFMLLLAGCGGGDTADQSTLATAEADARSKAADDGRVDCMPAGETEFHRACLIERSQSPEGAQLLTISHPDGGFRRLMIATDGRGVVAADGAEQAVVTTLSPREIEVSLGGNRYRLPATVKAPAESR